MEFEPYLKQDYASLKKELLKKGTLFEDPKFPATSESLFKYNIPGNITFPIKWKRPNEITRRPKFIENGISPNDLYQGALGDCWFIAGAVTMATQPELFQRVIPEDQSFEPGKYCGMFRFIFWRYGRWIEVVIDDRLPVDTFNSLLFCSNKKFPDEFWCALIEKAYAKVNGCYEFLDGGFAEGGLDSS